MQPDCSGSLSHPEGPFSKPAGPAGNINLRVMGFFVLPFFHLRTASQHSTLGIVSPIQGLCLLLGLFGLWTSPLTSAPISKYLGKTISAVHFASEDSMDDKGIRKIVPLREGDPLQEAGIRQSIEALYATRLFQYIEVSADESAQGVDLTFRLRPNYFFGDFRLSGNPVLRSPLSRLARLPIGEIYSTKTVQDMLLKVQEYLKDSGFYKAEVTPDVQFDSERRLANVTFLVNPGSRAVVSGIDLGGNPLLEGTEILGRMKLKSGKLFGSQRMRRDIERIKRLYSSRGFLNATIRVDKLEYSPADNTVRVRIFIDAGSFVYVELIGAKIKKKKLRTLIPIYEEGTVDTDLIEEGKRNLEDYFEKRGYFDVAVEHELIEVPAEKAYQINYTIKRGQKQKVVSIEFSGLQHYSEEELKSQLKTKVGRLINRGEFSHELMEQDADTIRNLYLRKGYESAVVTPESQKDRSGRDVAIRFVIKEGPKTLVEDVQFTGNDNIPRQDLIKSLGLVGGQPFSQVQYEEDRLLLEGKYYDRGYADIKIDSQIERLAGDKVRILYLIKEGESTKVGDLHVVGNRLTRRKVITRNINFHEGDPLSQDRFLTSQQKLYGLGLFDKVDIVPVNVSALDSVRPVIIRAEDASPITLGYGFGYNDREKVRGTFDITHNNLFGLARSLSFRTRASYREQRGQITYKEPRLFNHDLDSYITLFAENAQQTGFNTFRTNASVQVLKRVRKLDNFFFRYNFEIVDLSDVNVNPLAAGLGGQNFGTVRLSSFSTAWLRDTRDDPFDATSGFFNTANLRITAEPIGSETNFLSFFGQSQAHRKFGDIFVLATSLRLGLIKPFGSTLEVPISERFFAGGSTTLRGFDQDLAGPLDPTNVDPDTGEPLPLGGNAMVIVNVETRFPVTQSLTFTPFYDTGNVFFRISNLRISSFTNTLGIGFRYKTPFGPLRVDMGFNLDRDPRLPSHKIFFTVGNPF